MITNDIKEKVKRLIEEKDEKIENRVFGNAAAKNRAHALGQRLMNFFREENFKDFQTHNLRVSIATNAYQDTGDIVAVKEYMGHKKIETTIGYIKDVKKGSRKILSGTITLK